MLGEKKQQFDFVAVGDITTDAFIRLKDAHIHCNIDEIEKELCVRFADKIPYEFVEVIRAVGNSPNAAVCAARLGLNSALVSNLGYDENGRECLKTLKAEKISTDYVTVHNGEKTNYHYVLWYMDDRTILVKHEHYRYRFPKSLPPPKWLYLSSTGNDTEKYHDEIAEYLEKNKTVKLAFQPGTFQMSLGRERLAKIYSRAEIFFSNIEEAERILENRDPEPFELARKIAELGPKIVVLTDGPKGAYVSDGKEKWFMPTYPDPKPPFERTGAGDAFASTFTSILAMGKPLEDAMRMAPISSMLVVQEIGAQRGLPKLSELENYLKKSPPEYEPKKVQ